MDQTEGPLDKMPYSGSLAVQRETGGEDRGAGNFYLQISSQKPIASKVFASVIQIFQPLKYFKFFPRGREKIIPENLIKTT